jgi:hypothetical protein
VYIHYEVKITLEHTTEDQTRSRGIALRFLQPRCWIEWVVNATPRPLYLRERDLVTIVEEDWWAPGPIVHYKDQSVTLCGEILLKEIKRNT